MFFAPSFQQGPWHVDGRRNEMVIDSLTRTYAPLVAGRSLYSVFNSSTRAFALSFEVLPAVTDPTTLIYANRVRAPTCARCDFLSVREASLPTRMS